MELRTDPAESPFERAESSTTLWVWVAILIALAAAGIAGYYYWQSEPAEPPALATSAPPDDRPEAPGAQSAPLQAPPEPAIRHPLAQAPGPEAQAPSLPTLEHSDPMMRENITGLIGRQSFDALVWPTEIVRRIVATVDNLPRKTAPQRVMPVQPVPGNVAIGREGDQTILGEANFKRYSPYVRVFDMLDSQALVRRYVASYPLFQKAYQELGFPNQYFNDRLMEAIDNMLATPEVTDPIVLTQPKVLYEFAAPELEELSAGQKILLRMGPENAARVKSKLREIRRELLTAAGR